MDQGAGNPPPNDEASQTGQREDDRLEKINRCIGSLIHASQCQEAPGKCQWAGKQCEKMRNVIEHTKQCRERLRAACPVCKQLIALCCFHAKQCHTGIGGPSGTGTCPVPYCHNIRIKFRQQKRLAATNRRAEFRYR